jgi:hypothetical protein
VRLRCVTHKHRAECPSERAIQGCSGLSCVSCVTPSVTPSARCGHGGHGFAQPCGTVGVTGVTVRFARHTEIWLNHLTRPLSLLRREGVGPGRVSVRVALGAVRDAGGSEPIFALVTPKPHGYGRKQELPSPTSLRSSCKRPLITRKRYELGGRAVGMRLEPGCFKFVSPQGVLCQRQFLSSEKTGSRT